MKTALLCAVVLVATSLFAAVHGQDAICLVRPIGDHKVEGVLHFLITDGGLNVTADLKGLDPVATPKVSINIHKYANIAGDPEHTGGHFDPDDTDYHGCPENDPDDDRIEAGDLGNFDVDADGTIFQTKRLHAKTLLSGVTSILGRPCVVTLGEDPCDDDDEDDFSRGGHGVVGIANGAKVESGLVDPELKLFAHLVGGENCPKCEGVVTAELIEGTVRVQGRFSGLDQPAHGFHIHVFGDLTASTLTSAGGHYNPKNVLHGLPDDAVHHEGDLGNIQTKVGQYYYYDRNFTNVDPSKWVGRSFMVHADVDHGAGEECDQAGSAGPRLMAGVIGFNGKDERYYDVDALLDGVEVNNTFETQSCISPSNWVSPSVLGFALALFIALWW